MIAIKEKKKESKEKESKEKYPPLYPAGGNGGCGNNLFLKIPIQMG